MTAQYANVSNQVASLKELYTGNSDFMKDLVYKKNPIFALLDKDESPSGFAGKYIPVPLVYGTPQGRSSTFINAQSNQTAALESSFFVYRVKNYQLVTIENELLEATKDDAAAFVDQAKLQVDTGFRNISNDLAMQVFGSGTGVRGQISTITTGVIQLIDVNSVVQFENGMVLVSAATDGGSPRVALGYVVGVNRSKGTVTVSASQGGSAGTPASWAASDFLYVQGDIPSTGTTGTTSNLRICGFQGWLPATDPSPGENFWGVDRSVDRTRLAGITYDGSGQTIEEALVDATCLTSREGAEIGIAVTNFASWANLEKSMGSRVQYVDVRQEDYDIGFNGIRVNTPNGPISVIADRNCPSQRCFLLDMSTWKFRSLGKAPHILTYGQEGLDGLRTGTADALEIRIGFYGNLICNAPGWNATVALSA